MTKRWTIEFRLCDDDAECLIYKSFNLTEARDIVKRLREKIIDNGISPISTWVLEYGFITFEEVYKAQGYTLMGLSVTDTRKGNGTIS
ncbi:MAG: hypothetical protein E3J47_05885 [Candidatus Stahlbacteria bacterium]|nr:MAG: hypothetical protein E3J47_05885 [Candidatus Stahlbacteria bacterium]